MNTTNTSTAINPDIKNELAAIVCQAMDMYERKAEADKTVFRRICGSLDKELKAFDYTVPNEYTDRSGKKVPYNREVSCWYRIETAFSTLVRTIYRVDAVAKLPSENEADMRQFMLDTLERMKALSGPYMKDKE